MLPTDAVTAGFSRTVILRLLTPTEESNNAIPFSESVPPSEQKAKARQHPPRERPVGSSPGSRCSRFAKSPLASIIGVQVFDDGVPVMMTQPEPCTFVGILRISSLTIVSGSSNNPGTPSFADLQMTSIPPHEVTAPGTHTLTIELTDTDFTNPSGAPFFLVRFGRRRGAYSVSATLVTATYQGVWHPYNIPFGNGELASSGHSTVAAPGEFDRCGNSKCQRDQFFVGLYARDSDNPGSVQHSVFDYRRGDVHFQFSLDWRLHQHRCCHCGFTPPTITTSQQPASATVGGSISDTATVSGGYNPTGTVTFTLYSNPNGTGTPLYTSPASALSGGTASSGSYTTSATGTDYWVATYSGDSNNTPHQRHVRRAGDRQRGQPDDHDDPAADQHHRGRIDLRHGDGQRRLQPERHRDLHAVQQPQRQRHAAVHQPREPLSGGTASSGSYTTSATGTDYWVATYSGDSNNNTAHQRHVRRAGDVSAASPTITTSQQPATASRGRIDLRHGDGQRRLQPDRHGDLHAVQQPQRQRHAAVHRPRAAERQRHGHFGQLHDVGDGHGLLGGHVQRRQQQQHGHQRHRPSR